MSALIILCSLLLTAQIILVVFIILLYNRITNLLVINGAYQAETYRQTVEKQKNRKPTLPAVKEKVKGRSVTNTDDLVDIADLNWEDGYKALEDIGNG